MNKIHVLPQLLVNQIAAGECIERPASIVKELVENSIDADATSIEVQVEEAGTRLIRVIDNGHGISKDDLPLAITSHATSKLRSVEDLLDIHTLGFRGEALASVASVADVTISSCLFESKSGFKIRSSGGSIHPVEPVAINPGTIIEIYELFFNIPARRKFLKKNATEMGHITDTMMKLAISYPEAAFKLTNNNKTVFQVAVAENAKERIEQLLDIPEIKIISGAYERNGIGVKFYIAPPQISRPNNKYQYIYVNDRYIKDRTTLRALSDAYRDYLPVKRHPVAVLFLHVDPQDVDVNVHPTKAEVRYRDSSSVYSAVYHAVLNGLRQNDLTPTMPLQDRTKQPNFTMGLDQKNNSLQPKAVREKKYHTEEKPQIIQEAPDFFEIENAIASRSSNTINKNKPTHSFEVATDAQIPPNVQVPPSTQIPPRENAKSQEKTNSVPLFAAEPDNTPLRWFQVHDSYIVVETMEGLEVIDQHALHERIIYSKLKAQISQKKLIVQMLLFPVNIRLTATEMSTFQIWRAALKEVGVEAEVVGDDVMVRSVPQLLANMHAGDLLREILEQLENKKQISLIDIMDPIIEMMSCKAAVKAGDNLNPEEVVSLLKRKNQADNPFHCPHGRPTTLKITLKELEKHFKRT